MLKQWWNKPKVGKTCNLWHLDCFVLLLYTATVFFSCSAPSQITHLANATKPQWCSTFCKHKIMAIISEWNAIQTTLFTPFEQRCNENEHLHTQFIWTMPVNKTKQATEKKNSVASDWKKVKQRRKSNGKVGKEQQQTTNSAEVEFLFLLRMQGTSFSIARISILPRHFSVEVEFSITFQYFTHYKSVYWRRFSLNAFSFSSLTKRARSFPS